MSGGTTIDPKGEALAGMPPSEPATPNGNGLGHEPGNGSTTLRLGDDSVTHLLIALALSVGVTGAALTTRYGRLVLSSLRAGAGDDRSR